MPPEAGLLPLPARWRERIAPAWRKPLARLVLVWAAILLVTARDWARMADQWWNISTYNHILIVPAILAALVWIRREELARLTPNAWWPGLLALAGALFLWFLGRIGEVNTASQLGAVGAMQAAVLALLGPRAALGLLFPLAYALFLVPFGDELVPPLQMITAAITIALTGWSGVPARIEGVFIDTPAGLFEVAEACSGVQFLIAMVALGVLVAKTCFTGWTRRIAFLAACVFVPILANGVRAWGTIYIAQSQGIEFAAGFDHVFYGWIFFGLVLALVLGGAWRFFDRDPEDPGIDGERIATMPLSEPFERFTAHGRPVALGAAGLLLAFALWALLASRLEAPLSDEAALPSVTGWERVDVAPELAWEPRATGAGQRLLARYRGPRGQIVDVFVARYSSQSGERDPAAPNEGAVPPGTPWRWMSGTVADDGARIDRLYALGRIRREARTYYRHGSLLTGTPARLKLAVIGDRLALRARPTDLVIVSAVDTPRQDAGEAIEAFLGSTGPLGRWIDRIGESR